jgi:uncharacterized protein
MNDDQRPKRGFAAMDASRRRAISVLGGKAVPAEKRTFSLHREIAIAAGKKKSARNVKTGKDQ